MPHEGAANQAIDNVHSARLIVGTACADAALAPGKLEESGDQAPEDRSMPSGNVKTNREQWPLIRAEHAKQAPTPLSGAGS